MATLLPFSLQWYLTNNPDVANAVSTGLVDAFEHFNTFGNSEGRTPTPLFNAQEYLLKNPDIAAAITRGETTAYDHFVNFGAAEGRSPLNLFDQAFYLLQNPDVAAAVKAGTMSAVQHFLLHGQSEPRPFSVSIDLGAYLKANPDVAKAVQNGFTSALGHLMQSGTKEARDLGNGVNLKDFANDPTFTKAIAAGDFQAALERVGEVAPFLPTFVKPAGWTVPANTPIPFDFVPLDGKKLVIPEGVVVPEGAALPEAFAPTTPVVPPVTPPIAEGRTFSIDADSKGNLVFHGTAAGDVKFIASADGGVFEREGVKAKYQFTGDDKAILLNVAPNGIIANSEVVTTSFSGTLKSLQDSASVYNTVFVGAVDTALSARAPANEAWSITKDGLNIVLSSGVTLTGGFDVNVDSGTAGVHFFGGGISEGAVKGAVGGQHAIYVRNADKVSVTGTSFQSVTGNDRNAQARAIEVQAGVAAKVNIIDADFNGWVTGIYVNPNGELSVVKSKFTSNNVGIGTEGPAKLHVTGSEFVTSKSEDIGLTPGKIIGDVDISGNTYTGGIPAINNGNDTALTNLKGANVLVGTTGADALYGGNGPQTIFGLDGNDYITGYSVLTDSGVDILVGGKGADWLRGGNGSLPDDNRADVIYAGTLTEIDTATGVFAESQDSEVTGWAKSFEEGYAPWTNYFIDARDANILEGRGGNDVLVASNQKDVFLYKTRANSNDYFEHYPRLETTALKAFGTDTIHNFTVGVDKIAVVMNVGGGDHTFVSGAGGNYGQSQVYANAGESNGWTLKGAGGNYTLAFDSSKYGPAGEGEAGDFSIHLVGVKGTGSRDNEGFAVSDFFLSSGSGT
ncbi:hypothetical protein EKL30_09860 [Candidimonas sp. SYP-B2681]|uniref:hypothetical protein n=1 Tax=Candidimonas sp. SYP-B2681 TaxID=2497686 RepID=UPI000F88D187|nr:hypothetical protein [Candidimonas sp. SYP-B2681]RTZ43181.1 hypothetical protein EKL30_09860 [Candidimonas sp. SYP-B2681]